jgi:hypothetical protein
MSDKMRTTLLGGAASLVIVGALVFAMSSAGAQTYQGNNQSGPQAQRAEYQSEMAMRDANQPPAFQVKLARVADARDALKNASVRDEDGRNIGYVRDVVTTPNGDAQQIKIKVGSYWGMGGKLVMVDAKAFRYERDRNELTADMTKGQIESMPAIPR